MVKPISENIGIPTTIRVLSLLDKEFREHLNSFTEELHIGIMSKADSFVKFNILCIDASIISLSLPQILLIGVSFPTWPAGCTIVSVLRL